MAATLNLSQLQRCWEFEDAELQYEKSRRRNHWKFLRPVAIDNLYLKEALLDYHAWSEHRGLQKYSEPLPVKRTGNGVQEIPQGTSSSSSSSSGLPTLPIEFVHRIIGKYADRVVDRGSQNEHQACKAGDAESSLTLPKEVVNQIIGEYAEKAVDKGSKKEKKKHKKDKQKLKSEEEDHCEMIAPDETSVTVWERKLRILMSEFSMPREKAERVMAQADGEPFEAVRIVGEEVKATMESLANQISKKEAIQLHIQAAWSPAELRKAKQQWLAKAGVPRSLRRMALTGKISK
eukprot:TRINITY_DN30925_c0_g1_i1.p1 TRINITY_DN30925_c0_g1~~TRINITY_DN30925_c0_g1_i1.p1  ORF type:complete len:311 (+),score=65.03 TRINITY_DN30925_c0_g1_i1:63-935(+)